MQNSLSAPLLFLTMILAIPLLFFGFRIGSHFSKSPLAGMRINVPIKENAKTMGIDTGALLQEMLRGKGASFVKESKGIDAKVVSEILPGKCGDPKQNDVEVTVSIGQFHGRALGCRSELPPTLTEQEAVKGQLAQASSRALDLLEKMFEEHNGRELLPKTAFE